MPISNNPLLTKIAPEFAERRHADGTIDTSLLLKELINQYRLTNKEVEVDFRRLVNWVRLGDQLTHQVHPYPAKLLPNIAHFLVRASTLCKSGYSVLDPFCGSGTVALEASLAGHLPLVADSNPLALLITRVKTTPYCAEELRQLLRALIVRCSRLRSGPVISIVNHHIWYDKKKKRDLEILLRAITEIEDARHRDFFRVCFSLTARRLSRADPAISVPVRLREKQHFARASNRKIRQRLSWITSASVFSEFELVCGANIDRVAATNKNFPNRASAVQVGIDARSLLDPGSNTNASLKDGTIPLIVTSPPYGSAQKYVRAASLSLNWLGFACPNELSSLEARCIGREHLPQARTKALEGDLPTDYERLIRRIKKKNEQRARITRHYLHEMRDALREMSRVASDDARIAIVIGNNQVCGEPLRNDKFVANILAESSFNLEVHLSDHIKSRGLMTKRNTTASVIFRENVLVFANAKRKTVTQ